MGENNFKRISSNWHYVLPPSRPTLNELDRIRCYLLSVAKDIPIAILGSTIEYRDLLSSMNFENVTIFEMNMDFYEWTKDWLVSTPKEKVIQGNWLETINIYQNKFMVLLSDLTMGNIEYDQRLPFYRAIGDVLMQGGVFIDKVLTQHSTFVSLKQIRDRYENLPINLQTINRFNCEAFFCSELLCDGILDSSRFYQILESDFRDSCKLLRFLDKCRLITPENCVWYYGKNWEELSQDYFCSFASSISYEDDAESPYYGRLKHYFNFK